jgi:opacity protein-like surface antigen
MARRFWVAVCAAALAASVVAGAVQAGEVTGSGANVDQNQGVSWCSFSGLNDDPGAPLDGSGPNGPGGHSQSFGQDVKLGLEDPHALNPGVACNPNKTFLPPNPNRTH